MCALVTGVQTCALPIYHGVTILCVAVATAMIGFLMSGVLRRMTGVDHATAFLASMPGGPVEMANLARQYGGDPGPVVFAQTLRISAIVIQVPAALYYLLRTEERRVGKECDMTC